MNPTDYLVSLHQQLTSIQDEISSLQARESQLDSFIIYLEANPIALENVRLGKSLGVL